jgi:hypothetical protein
MYIALNYPLLGSTMYETISDPPHIDVGFERVFR